MQRSVFLAKLIGPLLAAIGTALIFNANTFLAMGSEFVKSHALIYVSGLLALTAGLAIVNLHTVGSADWRVAITIIGWLCVFGGVMRVVFPRIVEEIGTAILTNTNDTWAIGEGIIVLAIGAWLSYAGYAPVKSRSKGRGKP